MSEQEAGAAVDETQDDSHFDADAKSAKREGRVVTIGGRDFKPKKRSVKVMRLIGRFTKEAAVINKQLEDGEDPDPELQMELLVPMCKQIGALLIDKSDSPLSGIGADADDGTALLEFLEEELDYEDATGLMAFLGIGPDAAAQAAALQQAQADAEAVSAALDGRREDEVGPGQPTPPPAAEQPVGDPPQAPAAATPGTEQLAVPAQPESSPNGQPTEAVADGASATPSSPTSA